MNPRDSLTEAQFQSMIIERARARGWLVHHCRPAATSHGYRTPIQGDPGFPDLVLARNGRVLFIEVKTAKGRTSDAQHRWIDTLRGDRYDVTAEVWWPSDWPDIEILLDHYGATP